MPITFAQEEEKKEKQEDRILNYLRSGEARSTGFFVDLKPSILKPNSVIDRLRKRGYMITNITQDGTMAFYVWEPTCPMRAMAEGTEKPKGETDGEAEREAKQSFQEGEGGQLEIR